MTDYDERKLFIHTKLAPMVMAIDESISNVRYVISDGREFVEIAYRKGYPKMVHITGFSFTGIAKVVISRI